MSRILIIVLLLLINIVPSAALTVVPNDDDDEINYCDPPMRSVPGLHWALVTDLSFVSDGASADRRVARISFRPLHWFDDNQAATQDGDRLTSEVSAQLNPGDLPSGPVVLYLWPKVRRQLSGPVVAGDYWSYPGFAVPQAATSGQRGSTTWLAQEAARQASIAAAFQTIDWVQSQVLSEPLRDALLAGALNRLGYKDLAFKVVVASDQYSAAEQWGKLREIWRQPYPPSGSVNFDAMRRAVIAEHWQSLRGEGLSEAAADYQTALYLHDDPDQLAGWVVGERNATEALQLLDHVLTADPDNRRALRRKLEIFLSNGAPRDRTRETLSIADHLSRVAPDDALARQVLFASPQDLSTTFLRADDPEERNKITPPPEDLPLAGMQAHYVNLANAHLANANLHNFMFDELNAEHADLRGADLVVDMDPAPWFYSRLRNGERQMMADFTDSDLRNARLGARNSRLGITVNLTARFKGTRLDTATMTNISLEPLVSGEPAFEDARFNSAELDHVYFADMKIRNVDFSEARLNQVQFQRTTLDHVKFARADLRNVWFEASIFHEVDFSQTNLSNAHLEGSSYDCTTRFPPGFRPDRAGMIALSNRCYGRLTPRDYRSLTLSWQGKALPGSRFDGARFESANLPTELIDVSLKAVRAIGWQQDSNALPRDVRYEPGQCDTGIASLTSELINVKHLDRAKLDGVSIELFDAAAATISYTGPKAETAIARLKQANLKGAILKCGPGEDQDLEGWHKIARQAVERQKVFLAGLRTVKGIVIDKSCAGLH